MKKFKLTPKWVLNNLPQSYFIIKEKIVIATDIALDFVFIKQALQTLGIQYYESKIKIEDVTLDAVIIKGEDISLVSHQKQRELKQNKYIISRTIESFAEVNPILDALTILTLGLRTEFGKVNNDDHHIDEILNSLSEYPALKCKYFLDSEGKLGYNYEDQGEEFKQSEECELIDMFGVFAFFQINLEYFELRNPKWKGMNKTLSRRFPEIYDAYINLSKMFGFSGTARLISNLFHCGKYFDNKCLWNPDIDNWENDLLELNENYFEWKERSNKVIPKHYEIRFV